MQLSSFALATRAALAALVILVLMTGCERGPAIAPVTGIVTQDGEPLASATVEFQPDKGAPSYGITDATGTFEMKYQVDRKGALLGHHLVRVRTEGEITDPKTDTTRKVRESVPAAWNDETTLEHEVKKGKNVFNIDIEGKRERRRRRRNAE